MGRWTLDTSQAYVAMDLLSRVMLPYDLDPFGFNPLLSVLGRIFRYSAITVDVLLASDCLATMFRAVEIDGGRIGMEDML